MLEKFWEGFDKEAKKVPWKGKSLLLHQLQRGQRVRIPGHSSIGFKKIRSAK